MNLDTITERKKELGVAAAFVVIVVALAFLASGMTLSKSISLAFAQDRVRPGESTKLAVTIRNTLQEDVRNAVIEVVPESDVVIVPEKKRSEGVVGAGAYRKVDFDVAIAPTATEGSYKIVVRLTMNGAEPETATTYLNVYS
ncbi:MAG: hypothetical protein JW834_00825 [Candidatus Diapherotrites archaeon]|nr:hypothetical protein [Candidatus Diapherotrites archaeon]